MITAIIITSIIIVITFVTVYLNEQIKNSKLVNISFLHRKIKKVSIPNQDYSYSFEKNKYIFNRVNNFIILQVTDLHVGCGMFSKNRDRMAYMGCYNLIKKVKPNLIIITGDAIYPKAKKALNHNNYAAMNEIVTFMDMIEIPWTITFGNHEAQYFHLYNRRDLGNLLKKSKYCLSNFVNEKIDGITNQIIELRDKNDIVIKELVLLDSNDYINNKEYDGIHENQIKWYIDEIKKINVEENTLVKSLVFCHMPVNEFIEAEKAVKLGKNDAKLISGKNREITNPVVNSSLVTMARSLNSLEGIFVGHEHLNDSEIVYKGITYSFGAPLDYLAYLPKKYPYRGGTVITIDNGNIKIKKVLLNEIDIY